MQGLLVERGRRRTRIASRALGGVAAALVLAWSAGATPAAAIEGGAPAGAGDALSRVTVGIGTITQPGEDLKLSRCSGVLIGRDLVMTAAHCVRGDPLGALVVFYRGSQPVAPPYAAQVEARYSPDVGELTSHEVGVSLAELSTDLAVLRLRRPVADRVPLELSSDPRRVPSTLYIAGTGLSGGRAGRLRTAALKPVAATSTGLTLARVQGGSQVCYGDSGGPVVARDRRGTFVWGVASAVITKSPPCGTLVVVAPASQVFAATGVAR